MILIFNRTVDHVCLVRKGPECGIRGRGTSFKVDFEFFGTGLPMTDLPQEWWLCRRLAMPIISSIS